MVGFWGSILGGMYLALKEKNRGLPALISYKED